MTARDALAAAYADYFRESDPEPGDMRVAEAVIKRLAADGWEVRRAELDAAKWAELLEEARAFEAWYGTGSKGAINAWVGVSTIQGFYGGWSYDGDHIDDYDWDESTMIDGSGQTVAEVIDDLIGIARRYRKHQDEQRAAYAEEDPTNGVYRP